MNRRTPRFSTWPEALCLLTLSGLGFVLASGCSKSEAAPPPAAETLAAPSKGSKASTDKYVAEMKASGAYAVGRQGTVEVTLAPAADFHVNDKYPFKFKLGEAPAGVTFPKPVLQSKDGDGTFAEKGGSFQVPFTASRPGRVTITGVLSLSVCKNDLTACHMEKQELSVDVDVK
jgi:hypothetical protein